MTQPEQLTSQEDQSPIDASQTDEFTAEDHSLYEGYDPEEYKPAENNANKSVITEFIKQLKPGMELYRVSIPVFILQPISLLEKVSIYSTPTSALHQLCTNENLSARERMLFLTNWLLSTWRSVPRLGIHESKPYNPILGEQFHCEFDHSDEDGSVSVFAAEQVRHHPPVSAFHLENAQRGFVYCGWIYPKTQFGMNSFTTPIEGNMFVELKKYGEIYRLQYPPVKASGILLGTRMIQVTGSMEITCEKTNLKSVTHFSTTSGDNSVYGEISNIHDGKVHYKISGLVHDVVKYTDMNSSPGTPDSPSVKTKKRSNLFSTLGIRNNNKTPDTTDWEILYDCSTIKKSPKLVPPLHEQEPNHSRRVWHKLTRCLRGENKNYDQAQTEKHIIEEGQRMKKIDESTWQQALFNKDENEDWRFIGGSSNVITN